MLQAVERKIEQYIFSLEENEIELLQRKLPAGKRLRAKLILKIAGETPSAVNMAAVVEMIHAASLLHDDVIDDADIRRSKPSLNALYGNKTAIMLGDILYAKGFLELSQIDKKIAQIISNAVVQLSIGELKDVSLSIQFNSNKEEYLKMIYQKTASLMEASAGAAALIAGKDVDAYMTYGRNLGMAFQMIDDILDITSDTQTLGKPAFHDYEEGKTTLPYIYLYETLDERKKKRLLQMHGKKLNDKEKQWLMDQMHAHGIISLAYRDAETLISEAIKLMNERDEKSLSQIAMAMIERKF